jgi:hypothetical protein
MQPENVSRIEKGENSEFFRVLKVISLGVPYKIHELEFEFDIKWLELKKLLDKHATYSIDGERIILDSREPATLQTTINEEEQHEDNGLTQEEREEMDRAINLFYVSKKDRHKYRPLVLNKLTPEQKRLLKHLTKISGGLVFQEGDKIVLHKFLRRYRLPK